MKKKRIFIACVDERLRMALFLFLENRPCTAVVGITDRLESLLPQLQASQPDVLLLDWEMTLQMLADLLTQVHSLPSRPWVIYLSNNPDEKIKMQEAGADYVVLKNAPPDELLPILNGIQPYQASL